MKFSVFHSDIVKSLLLIFSASCFAGNTNDNSINIAGYGVDELPGDIYSSVNTAPRKIGDIYHTPTFHMDYEPSSIPESGAENATLLHHFTCKNSFTWDDAWDTQTTTFALTDEYLCHYTVWNTSNINNNTKIYWKIYRPEGTLYSTLDYDISANSEFELAWFAMKIKYIPEPRLGTWSIELYHENQYMATDEFKIIEKDSDPSLLECFTCKNIDNPDGTRSDTFSLEDEAVGVFTRWNTANSSSKRQIIITFFKPDGKYYYGIGWYIFPGFVETEFVRSMPIVGNESDIDTGTWTVKIYMDEISEAGLIAEYPFDITTNNQNETSTPYLLDAMLKIFVNTIKENMQDEYYNNLKHLGVLSAGFFKTMECFIYVDLDDYAGFTAEGKDGWVTVWADAGITAGIGFLPVTFGLTKAKIKATEPDPSRNFDFSGPAVAAGSFKIKWFEMTDEGFDWGIVNATESVDLNMSASLGAFSWNLYRFEMRKSALNDLIGDCYKLSPGNILVSLAQNSLINSLFDFSENSVIPELSINVSPNDFREFTQFDDGTKRDVNGIIEYARGGIDVESDGMWDNYFLKSYSINQYIVWNFALNWRSIGNSEADYSVVATNIPQGWIIGAKDDDIWAPIVDHSYDSKNISPRSSVETEWLIGFLERSTDDAIITFVLYEDKMISSDVPLDTVMIHLHKIEDDPLAFNAYCPIDIGIRTPSGKKMGVDIDSSVINNYNYNLFDINADGDQDVQVVIAYPEVGKYQIEIYPRSDAMPEDSFTLEAICFGNSTILVDDVLIRDITEVAYSYQYTNTSIDQAPLPDSYSLHQNYPNPFNPSTTIRYTVSESQRVVLTIYNTLGREIACLVDGMQVPGVYFVIWNGQDQPSGIYICHLTAGDNSEICKLILQK